MTTHYKTPKDCKDADIASNRGTIRSIAVRLGKTRKKNQQNNKEISLSPKSHSTQDTNNANARRSNRQTKQATRVIDGHANRRIRTKREVTKCCSTTHLMPTIKEDETSERSLSTCSDTASASEESHSHDSSDDDMCNDAKYKCHACNEKASRLLREIKKEGGMKPNFDYTRLHCRKCNSSVLTEKEIQTAMRHFIQVEMVLGEDSCAIEIGNNCRRDKVVKRPSTKTSNNGQRRKLLSRRHVVVYN
eukprot:6767774-Ditylum_brightwellii.AAC.1